MTNKSIAVFLAVIAGMFIFVATASAYTLVKDSTKKTVSWNLNDLPISYHIHVDDPLDAETNAKVRSVVRAFESWELASFSLISFHYAGLTDKNAPAYDNVNLVTWVKEDWTHDPSQIAFTTLTIEASTDNILDADIEINEEYFDWSTEGEEEKMDLQNALTHEAGHFVGIGHSIEATDTAMFALADPCEIIKRIIKADDIAASVHLYPVIETGLTVYSLPSPDMFKGFLFAEEVVTNYAEIGNDGKLCFVSGISLPEEGGSSLAVIKYEDDKEVFYLYGAPGVEGERLSVNARDAWVIPSGTIKDFTTVDIDADGADELAVLRLDEKADHVLYLYDAPPEGSFEDDGSRTWIAEDLWRIPGKSDNLLVFNLDLDGDGKYELATLTYSVEGIYIISVFSSPNRWDFTEEDALARGKAFIIPFTIEGTIIDLDSIDANDDGISEAVALVKTENGYSIQVLPLSLPAFPEEVQKLKPLLTMQLILEQDDHPYGLTVIEGPGQERPEILILTGKSEI